MDALLRLALPATGRDDLAALVKQNDLSFVFVEERLSKLAELLGIDPAIQQTAAGQAEVLKLLEEATG